jgi:hypothetical protein
MSEQQWTQRTCDRCGCPEGAARTTGMVAGTCWTKIELVWGSGRLRTDAPTRVDLCVGCSAELREWLREREVGG